MWDFQGHCCRHLDQAAGPADGNNIDTNAAERHASNVAFVPDEMLSLRMYEDPVHYNPDLK
jgi:hypothetical protein